MQKDNFKIGGVLAQSLVERYGSPLYVYDASVIRRQYEKLAAAINYEPLAIHYSCKVNTNAHIMRVLKQLGSEVECVSLGEIKAARKAGFKPEDIIYTCSYIEEAELKRVIDMGIKPNLDSLNQLEWFGKYKPGNKVSIRVNQGIGAGGHSHIITGGPNSKFGIDLSQINQAHRIAKRYKLKIIGLHQHIGSSILDGNILLKAVQVLIKTASDFSDIELLNFGGGLGTPYKKTDKQLNIDKFGKEFSKMMEKFSAHVGRPVTALFEPGRYLVAQSGFLLSKVTDIKRNPSKTFIGINTGFNHLVRPILYDAYHEVVNTSRTGPTEKVTIAGNLCESGDLLARDRAFPKATQIGDVVAILDAGASGYSMSSNYNSRLKPAEVLVDNGKARLIRKPA